MHDREETRVKKVFNEDDIGDEDEIVDEDETSQILRKENSTQNSASRPSPGVGFKIPFVLFPLYDDQGKTFRLVLTSRPLFYLCIYF